MRNNLLLGKKPTYTMMKRLNRIISAYHLPIRLCVLLWLLLFSTSVLAIPSPDLVINLSASIAQLLGLISVLLGGAAFSSRKKLNKRNGGKIPKTSRLLFFSALTLLIISLGINLLQYTGSVDAKNSRLHTNLTRKSIENGKSVGDTSLKTLSFSDQKTHPLGISTDTMSNWLESEESLNIFDIRENAEVEAGMISNAQHIRFPDLLANPALVQENGNKNLFLCYSGNRSSELCETLSGQGKACNFMVGGYEKWLSESRPLDNLTGGSTTELRDIPEYNNKKVLLDTPDVHRLVNEENAEFVDVRYPVDFNADHLPGAYNITMRALQSAALEEKLSQLPDVPLIAACYDKRSCFYSQLIGLSLNRIGRDYRGRYTVPNEYYLPGSERSHVANWRVENEQITLIKLATAPLSTLLHSLSEYSGHYAIGIFLLVLLVRLLLFPLTIKAERDQVVLKSLKPTINRLRSRYASHPRALSKAILKLYRVNKIKPVFNLIASVSQLGLLLLFFSVVDGAANGWTDSFLWIETASAPDRLFILPLLVSGLFAFIIARQLKPLSKKKIMGLVAGGILFFALIQALSAAVNIYFTFSMLVLIAQGSLIGALSLKLNWDGSYEDLLNTHVDDGLIPLRYAHLFPIAGKKASRLGELIAAGYNVPDGFVVTDMIASELVKPDEDVSEQYKKLPGGNRKKLECLWKEMKAEKVAVRSSGTNEDGADTSFAGVYDSILNVSKEQLPEAIATVYQSLSSSTATHYNNAVNSFAEDILPGLRRGGVVIQKMVDAEYAGVMFTEHPTNAGAMLIEVVSGLGEDLVSGTVTPDSYSFGRNTGQPLDDQQTPVDLQDLIQLGRKLEEHFHHPQDIEWAYANGKFYLLQARDITRSICDRDSIEGYTEAERRRLLAMVENHCSDDNAFEQNELSELLPAPTPLSASFMHRLWAAEGSTDLACQQLGIPYNVDVSSKDFVTTVFGKTYINKVEEKLRLGKGPGALSAFNLARNAEQIEEHFRNEFLPAFFQSVDANKAMDYSRLTLAQMLNSLDMRLRHFITEIYVEAEVINIAADYYWKTADAKLKGHGLDPARYLNYVPDNAVSSAMALITSKDANQDTVEKFIDTFGHRAPYDYELSAPRYSEDPSLVVNLMRGHSHTGKKVAPATMPNKKLLRISVDRVQRFQALKEDAKHFCMMELNEIRKLLLAIDQACEFEGGVFYLSIDELLSIAEALSLADAQTLITRRKQREEKWSKLSPPAELSVFDLESMDTKTGAVHRSVDSNALTGKRVAGDEEVKGVVRVIQSVEEIKLFQDGEILVARMTDPQWYPLFPKAKGIITEVGGWLSHAAIVAREYNLPAIVGVPGACTRLSTGDIVELHSDGSLTQHTDQRRADSPMREKSVPETSTVSTITNQLLEGSTHAQRVIPIHISSNASREDKHNKRLERRRNARQKRAG